MRSKAKKQRDRMTKKDGQKERDEYNEQAICQTADEYDYDDSTIHETC